MASTEEKIDYIYKSLLKQQVRESNTIYDHKYIKDHEDFIVEYNNPDVFLKYIKSCKEADVDKCFDCVKKYTARHIIEFFKLVPTFSKEKIKNAILNSYSLDAQHLEWVFNNLGNLSITELEDRIIKRINNMQVDDIIPFLLYFKGYKFDVQRLRNVIVEGALNKYRREECLSDFDNIYGLIKEKPKKKFFSFK
jgi:hypothetical protein